MKNQQLPDHHYQRRSGTNLIVRLNTSPRLSIVLIILSYVILLIVSYSLGYLVGSSFGVKDITTFVISKTSATSRHSFPSSSEPQYSKYATQCAKQVPPEFVRQTIIDRVYNGTSPYEDFIPQKVASPLLPIKINGRGSYGMIYQSLIQDVRPRTIIKFRSSLVVSATNMANLTSQLGLKTQILCLDEFHSWPVFRDLFEDIAMPNGGILLLNQFIENVITQNATESIMPVPLSANLTSEKLCEWGIYGDLIEVNGGHDFHSAWSDINKAYKLLRPGGVLFGHNYFSSYYDKGVRQAVRLFARVNKFRVKTDGHHWIINSA